MTVTKVDNPKVELSEEALKILRDNLEPTEMVAMELLLEGEKMSALVTKVHLSRVISFMARELDKLGWAKTTEAGEKPFTCSKCDKKFPEIKDLEEHDCAKAGEKPFTCSKCDKKFPESKDLEVHDCAKGGEKPFTCSKCEKPFPESKDLEQHICDKAEKKKEICRFYKSGYCKYKKDCKYEHPKICRNFEKFGYKDGGCKARNCDQGLHLNLCKFFMRGECKKERCSWFHPKNLRKPEVHQTRPSAPWARSACSPWQNEQRSTMCENNNVAGFVSSQAFLELSRKVDKLIQGLSGRT